MANFLLWNVQRKPLDELVLRLVVSEKIDAVFLVEYADGLSRLPDRLAGMGFTRAPSHTRFGVFARSGYDMGRLPVSDLGTRVDYFVLTSPTGREGLIAAVHGQDRRNYTDADRAVLFNQVARTVRFEERRRGHRRSIVLGDFNADPFDPAVVSVHGLHAIGVKDVRGRVSRRVGGEDHDFFYNPMWRLYGHTGDAGTATHYYLGGHATEYAWHMLDQVVVRPDTVPDFDESLLRVLTSIGSQSLGAPKGVPDATVASDHFPIVFKWAL